MYIHDIQVFAVRLTASLSRQYGVHKTFTMAKLCINTLITLIGGKLVRCINDITQPTPLWFSLHKNCPQRLVCKLENDPLSTDSVSRWSHPLPTLWTHKHDRELEDLLLFIALFTPQWRKKHTLFWKHSGVSGLKKTPLCQLPSLWNTIYILCSYRIVVTVGWLMSPPLGATSIT